MIDILIAGNANVGKTRVIERIRRRSKESSFISSSLLFGCNVYSTIVDGEMIKLYEGSTQDGIIQLIDAVLLVVDVTNRKSFDDIAQWLKVFGQKKIIFIVANKIDVTRKRMVSLQEIRKLNIPYFESSDFFDTYPMLHSIVDAVKRLRSVKNSFGLAQVNLDSRNSMNVQWDLYSFVDTLGYSQIFHRDAFVYCSIGCGTKLPGDDPLSLHEHQLYHCPNRLVLCPLGCDSKVVFKFIQKHVDDSCPNRVILCSTCGELFSGAQSGLHRVSYRNLPFRSWTKTDFCHFVADKIPEVAEPRRLDFTGKNLPETLEGVNIMERVHELNASHVEIKSNSEQQTTTTVTTTKPSTPSNSPTARVSSSVPQDTRPASIDATVKPKDFLSSISKFDRNHLKAANDKDSLQGNAHSVNLLNSISHFNRGDLRHPTTEEATDKPLNFLNSIAQFNRNGLKSTTTTTTSPPTESVSGNGTPTLSSQQKFIAMIGTFDKSRLKHASSNQGSNAPSQGVKLEKNSNASFVVAALQGFDRSKLRSVKARTVENSPERTSATPLLDSIAKAMEDRRNIIEEDDSQDEEW